jgi:hypothetical protein
VGEVEENIMRELPITLWEITMDRLMVGMLETVEIVKSTEGTAGYSGGPSGGYGWPGGISKIWAI